MVNHACIAIGISGYQFLQPLKYGQADAQALRRFLVEQASLTSNQCLLLTDTSAPVGESPTYPTKENLLSWLENVRQDSHHKGSKSLSGDWCWCFFSGHGISWEKVDYLMPIDGNPNDIPGTGIPMRSLFESLQAQGSKNILVLLDINRSPGHRAGTPVGAETVELARQMGITLLLSTQLEQFSHEAAALGKGLFTAVLLEALHCYGKDITLENLYQYLRIHLPELSRHHWRPVQTPLLVMSTEAVSKQRILPSVVNLSANGKTTVGTPVGLISLAESGNTNGYQRQGSNSAQTNSQNPNLSVSYREPIRSLIPSKSGRLPQIVSRPGAIPTDQDREWQSDKKDTPWWQQLLLWGSAAAVILVLMIAGVVFRNREAFTNQNSLGTTSATPSPTKKITDAASSNLLITKSPAPSPAQNLNNEQPVSTPSPASRPQNSKVTLDQAKRLLKPNQAYPFHDAIAVARQVPASDPLYEEAQQYITNWSEIILDIAQERAQRGNFSGAIAAARLVPPDDPSIHGKAEQAIEQWQILYTQQQQNQGIIQVAKKQLQPNQAWSYQKGILTLRQVPSGQPGYAEAQKLIAQWSEDIYLFAHSRASRGNLGLAVETARLVPKGTPAYNKAQQVIARWQK
ncbi:caspase family protein [Lyngbya aestuarii]|uniref:caspase family protein n=1 Tax=Lyngbya aestuarii TaxID=118322 RepID=UPI00403D63D8